jgi:hypothetical protein
MRDLTWANDLSNSVFRSTDGSDSSTGGELDILAENRYDLFGRVDKGW